MCCIVLESLYICISKAGTDIKAGSGFLNFISLNAKKV